MGRQKQTHRDCFYINYGMQNRQISELTYIVELLPDICITINAYAPSRNINHCIIVVFSLKVALHHFGGCLCLNTYLCDSRATIQSILLNTVHICAQIKFFDGEETIHPCPDRRSVYLYPIQCQAPLQGFCIYVYHTIAEGNLLQRYVSIEP